MSLEVDAGGPKYAPELQETAPGKLPENVGREIVERACKILAAIRKKEAAQVKHAYNVQDGKIDRRARPVTRTAAVVPNLEGRDTELKLRAVRSAVEAMLSAPHLPVSTDRAPAVRGMLQGALNDDTKLASLVTLARIRASNMLGTRRGHGEWRRNNWPS